MKPVLVGMNNPFSADPRLALFPAPAGVTGHRIFQMLQEVGAVKNRKEYIDGFDRRNVINSVTWDKKAARAAGPALWASLDGRTVALLGREVVDVVCPLTPKLEPLEWHVPLGSILKDGGPARVCYIPHPSGLNHWYNNRANWVAVGLRLEQMLEEGRR